MTDLRVEPPAPATLSFDANVTTALSWGRSTLPDVRTRSGPVGAPWRAVRREVQVGQATIRLLESGPVEATTVVLLHGWPQTSRCWTPLMRRALDEYHLVAIDLPGVGHSHGASTDGTKEAIAAVIHGVVAELELGPITLVGHDIGAMVAYAYLRRFDDVERAVLMDAVIPGLAPWATVVSNPRLWHFALHAVPELPETLVQGHQRAYFDFFFDVLLDDPASISPEARETYASDYGSDAALRAGFDWYRAFPRDADTNAGDRSAISTPVLYLRGVEGMTRATTSMDDYLAGLRDAGVRRLHHDLISGAVHHLAEEAPEATWAVIAEFIRHDVAAADRENTA